MNYLQDYQYSKNNDFNLKVARRYVWNTDKQYCKYISTCK